MLKNGRLLFPLLILLLLLNLFISPKVSAQTFDRRSELVQVTSDQVIDRDYFAASGKIIIDGIINGDVYLFGGDLEVNGKINGDLIAAGGNIRIKGEVTQDLRVAGGNLTLEGKVGRNVSVAGGNINSDGTNPIPGNFWVAGGDVSIRQPIQRNLYAAAGNLYVDTTVGESINAYAEQIAAGNTLKVGGDVNYKAENMASLPPSASVSGKVNYTQAQNPKPDSRFIGNLTRGAFYFSLYTNIALFLVGWLIWYLFPKFSQNIVNNLDQKPLLSGLIGLLSLAVLPFLFVILLITVLGIPVALLLLIGSLVAFFVAHAYIASWIGQKISKTFNYNYSTPVALLVGLLVLFVLSLIPIVNVIVWIAVVLMGLGALLKTKFDYYHRLRKDNLL